MTHTNNSKILMAHTPNKRIVFISPSQLEDVLQSYRQDPTQEHCQTLYEIGYYLADESTSIENFDEENKFHLLVETKKALQDIPADIKQQMQGVDDVVESLDSVIKIASNSPARRLVFATHDVRNAIKPVVVANAVTRTPGAINNAA